jgi:hypothetical protein
MHEYDGPPVNWPKLRGPATESSGSGKSVASTGAQPSSAPPPAAGDRREGVNKGGRPGLGAPWKALGLSRAAYFRRKKDGAL